MIVGPAMPMPTEKAPFDTPNCDCSSAKIAASSAVPARPPATFGQVIPAQPPLWSSPCHHLLRSTQACSDTSNSSSVRGFAAYGTEKSSGEPLGTA